VAGFYSTRSRKNCPTAHPPRTCADPGWITSPTPQAPWRRGRVRLIAAIVIVVLVVLGFVLQHVTATSPKGSIALPGTLLGVSENTSPAAQAAGRTFAQETAAGTNKGVVLHVVARVYGSLSGSWFAVAGGGSCGSCAPVSAAAELRHVRQTVPGARLFPPGPNGGNLVCAPVPGQNAVFGCWWGDDKTAGAVAYAGGSASGLADAAAKTRQIRAAVEH
jgi:hypothetical protein